MKALQKRFPKCGTEPLMALDSFCVVSKLQLEFDKSGPPALKVNVDKYF